MTRRGGGVTPFRGQWRARLYHEGKTVSLGIYATEAEAREAVRTARVQLAAELHLPGDITLRDFGQAWLDRLERSGRMRGIAQEQARFARIDEAPFAALPVHAVTRAHVVRWVNWLSHDVVSEKTGRPLSRQTVVHLLSLLRRILGAALDEERVSVNVAASVKVPRRDGAATWTWLRPDEIEAVLTADVPEVSRCLWTVAIYSGLRRGELAMLQWRDVDFDRCELHVRRSMSEGAPTKSGKARKVPLLPPALAALRRWREATEAELRAAPVARLLRPDSPVWASATGGHHGKDWTAGWRDYVTGYRRKGDGILARAVRFHDLRHTCGSHLIQGTWGEALTLYEVRDWLGHGSAAMTERYAHLAPEGLSDRAARMAANWTDTAPTQPTRPIVSKLLK